MRRELHGLIRPARPLRLLPAGGVSIGNDGRTGDGVIEEIFVRPATTADRPAWARMRYRLWDDADPGELESELAELLASGEDFAVFVAEAENSTLVGFSEFSIRSYVEGPSAPGPYLEGIWVDPDLRRRGIARALLEAGQRWARERGFDHLGSDALIDNGVSHAWHEAAGFAEVERIVVFGKRIG